MAIEKEPGQKGVNWSNIAVGKFNLQQHQTFNRQLNKSSSLQVPL